MVLPIQCLFSSVSIAGLRLKVRLGCGEAERQVPQYVSFDAEVRFKQPPKGCLTDRLEETVCYAEMSEKIRALCEQNEFHLIEKLGWDVYSAIKEILPAATELKIRVTKEKPPVPDLHGGSVFVLGDWI
ncbi:MAG: dihydroneopterin aldolase [Bdellovibrionia bacterium]